jgi:hypothetical protein
MCFPRTTTTAQLSNLRYSTCVYCGLASLVWSAAEYQFLSLSGPIHLIYRPQQVLKTCVRNEAGGVDVFLLKMVKYLWALVAQGH